MSPKAPYSRGSPLFRLPSPPYTATVSFASMTKLTKLLLSLTALLTASGSLIGCSSNGVMPQSTATAVSLKENNYKVIKAGARGHSTGFYLFGLIPIVSPNYADAKSSLYTAVGEQLEGRSIALANQTQDHSTIYLILFSIPRLVVTADIVEFTHPASTGISATPAHGA